MQTHPVTIDKRQAHWFELSQQGAPIHFYHANAYPFGVYRQFLQGIAVDHRVFGLANRATWHEIGHPPKKLGWSRFANDLIEFLEVTNSPPVIGMGHSLGAGVTMLAASKRPDLFKGLVLIDPVFFAPRAWLFNRLMIRLGVPFPLQDKTLARPDQWDSRQACIDFHRPKRAFSRFSESALQDFAEYGLTKTQQRCYRLSFPKEWEAHVYGTAPYIWSKLKSLEMPVLGIRGDLTDVLFPAAWRKWQQDCPDHTLLNFPELGHLAPLEAPDLVSQSIVQWLKTVK